MTVLQEVFDHYLNIKFNRGLPAVQMNDFEYVLLEDTSAELFLLITNRGHFWNGQRHFNHKIHIMFKSQTGDLCLHLASSD